MVLCAGGGHLCPNLAYKTADLYFASVCESKITIRSALAGLPFVKYGKLILFEVSVFADSAENIAKLWYRIYNAFINLFGGTNMSEDKKTFIKLVPEAIDNATKNIIDEPTKNIGTTLADIWYLIFGGISQAADKRKLKYSYALQEFENELKEKISKIPKNKCVEPDMQIIGTVLDASKYCIEKSEIRRMFVKLIESSLHSDYCQYVHPSYVEIIKQMSPMDAKIFNIIMPPVSKPIISIEIRTPSSGLLPFCRNCSWITEYTPAQCATSFSSLSRLGLINIDRDAQYMNKSLYNPVRQNPHFIKAQNDCLQNLKEGEEIYFREQYIATNELSDSFYKACIG